MNRLFYIFFKDKYTSYLPNNSANFSSRAEPLKSLAIIMPLGSINTV